MEKYLIYYYETSTSKKYVEYISRSGESTDVDMGDAVEFDNKDLALMICDFLNRRSTTNRHYKVMCIKTTIIENIDEEDDNNK